MSSTKIAFAAALLAGALIGGAAQARGPAELQWQLNIGATLPIQIGHAGVVVRLPLPPVPVFMHSQPAPHAAVRWDHDGDRIPYRHHGVYNPRWDHDGDGIPNRYDRVYNPRWDRDGDGIPNRYDRHPNHAGYAGEYRGHKDWRDDRRDARQADRRDDRRDERRNERRHGRGD